MTAPAGQAIKPSELEKLTSFAEARPYIDAVFLYGSVARGEAASSSDLDLGVLLTHEANENGTDILRLVSDLMDVFGREDIDVAILNNASPLLLHRVARDGHVLYATSNRVVAEFHIRAIQQFEDTRPLRKLRTERLDRLLERSSQEQVGS